MREEERRRNGVAMCPSPAGGTGLGPWWRQVQGQKLKDVGRLWTPLCPSEVQVTGHGVELEGGILPPLLHPLASSCHGLRALGPPAKTSWLRASGKASVTTEPRSSAVLGPH